MYNIMSSGHDVNSFTSYFTIQIPFISLSDFCGLDFKIMLNKSGEKVGILLLFLIFKKCFQLFTIEFVSYGFVMYGLDCVKVQLKTVNSKCRLSILF